MTITNRPDMFSGDLGAIDSGKPNVVIYASCHGRTLYDYLRTRPDLWEKYNVLRLETGPISLLARDGHAPFEWPEVRRVFQSADIFVTYRMGARMGIHSLDNILPMVKPGARVITFTAPNFSAFQLLSHGYASDIGVTALLDKGLTVSQIWGKIESGDYDPLFGIRYRLEMGRILDKDAYHDIGLGRFIQRNHTYAKLWMGFSHPSYVTMSYVGNELCGLLGLAKQAEEDILALDYRIGTMAAEPETRYEFLHYGFEFPMRHQNEQGGMEFFRKLLDTIHDWWRKTGAMCPPVPD